MKTLILTLIVSLIDCSTGFCQEITNVLKISAFGSNKQEVSLISYEVIGKSRVLAKSNLDSTGNVNLMFSLQAPQFITLKLGKKFTELFFVPNDTLSINIDFGKTNSTIGFLGKNALHNQYLYESSKIFEDMVKPKVGLELSKLKIEDFIDRLDSISMHQEVYHQRFINQNKIPKEILFLLKSSIKLNIFSLKMNRYYALYDPFIHPNTIPPTRLLNLEKQLLLDKKLLSSKNYSYIVCLSCYILNTNSNSLIAANDTSKLNINDKFLKISFQNFNKDQYLPEIREFLLAKSIYESFSKGKVATYEFHYDLFVEQFPNSVYIESINQKLAQIIAINKGTVAPNFSGTTPTGKTVFLNEFSDKIVFIDFWATWCGPCVKELPNTVALENKFKANRDVVFLYVSIDKDKTKWTNYLAKHPEQNGIHINIEADKVQALQDAYRLNAIPGYVMIGKDGKIINAYMQPPSSGKVEELLDSLLSKK